MCKKATKTHLKAPFGMKCELPTEETHLQAKTSTITLKTQLCTALKKGLVEKKYPTV